MPFATNAVDGTSTYYEDEGGTGSPIIFYAGLTQPLATARQYGISRQLASGHRLVFADHRGHGHSDKPHNIAAYEIATRVGDVVAVLDALGIDRAVFVGFSWGARLGFAIGEHEQQRVKGLILCGNQPYAWDPDWPIVKQFSAGLPDLDRGDMAAAVKTWESHIEGSFPEPERTFMLDNDPLAMAAAWRSGQTEGPLSRDLTRWDVPCLIYAGETDPMHDNARRAAEEIPRGTFLSLKGQNHFTASHETDVVMPYILSLLQEVA